MLSTLALTVAAGCSSESSPTNLAADVPVQTGQQSVLFDAIGASSLAVDAKNTLYMGGSIGILTYTRGEERPKPLPHTRFGVSTLAVAPDGALYFVTLEHQVQTLKPGSTTPEPLPFGELREWSGLAVSRDGTVYLGDNSRDVLLKLAPGAQSPTEVPVSGASELGHLVIDADDNLYASSEGKIVKIAKDATTAEVVEGAPADAGGLAVDAAGNLYATDVKAGTVSRMPAGGGDWVQLPFNDIQSPTRIAVDGDGNVYVVAAIRGEGLKVVSLTAK
ncbi:hypothetical protein BHQ18_13985 [Mycolicibacterium flavescens]|uniref:Uncharacterized protein n=1 Tax=Mycolicibacterium flavescens TaxID=1776 RepID=A0A1E3RJE7_MYCFV|nr:hypothetical protein BHQ18_13985 [Mycolicibacterium flavescens]